MKLDINISKTITINTGNYNSIKPTVSINAKDIDINNTEKVYKILSSLIGNLLYIETIEMCDNSKSIQEIGIKNFIKSSNSMIESIKIENEEMIEKLKNINNINNE